MDVKLILYLLLLFSGVSQICCFRYAPVGDIARDIFSDKEKNIHVEYYSEDFHNTSGDGSGEVDTTTEPPTIPTTTLTTTPPPFELPDLTDEVFPMELSFSFNASCETEETCEEEYDDYVVPVLQQSFELVPDFLGFINIEVTGYETGEDAASYAPYSTNSSTIVRYNANYDLQTALDESNTIIQTIETTVFDNLKSSKINGLVIYADYIEEVATAELDQSATLLSNYSNNLCLFDEATDSDLCDFGYLCMPTENDTAAYGAYCEYKCLSYETNCDDDYGLCMINEFGNAECICEDNTLQISSTTCFHQNYLIFICAVGGGVLIIALIVVITVLVVKRRRGESDRASRTSAKDILHHERYDADAGQSFQMQNERGGSISSRSSENRGLDQGSTTFVGPSKGKSKSKEPRKRSQHHQAHHNKAYDWDDSERVRLEDLEDDRKRSHYDPYYQEILESESFKDFKPKLDHIDHNKVYAFRRPMFTSRDGGESSKTYESRWEDTD